MEAFLFAGVIFLTTDLSHIAGRLSMSYGASGSSIGSLFVSWDKKFGIKLTD